jgi:drug/metabolite transporter (DMT)-like permease
VTTVPPSVVALSLLSAAAFGLGAVLQQHAAVRQPRELSMRFGLLVRLASRRIWLAGLGLDWLGFLFQFLALTRGSLSLVEPILVLSLVFAFPVSAWLEHRRVTPAELGAAGMLAGGLALFLRVGRPGAGHPDASGAAWTALSAAVLLAVGVIVLSTRRRLQRRAAVLLGAGSGIAFAYVAAIARHTAHLLDRGVLFILGTWAPYALIVGAVAALLLTQSAFHAGELRLSLPVLAISEPLVAIAIGAGFFGENIHTSGLAPVWEVAALGLMTAGVFALATPSTLVVSESPT